MDKIYLKTSEAVGLQVFKFWHTCPNCKYVWITEADNYCGKCGREIVFITPQDIYETNPPHCQNVLD